MEVRVEAVDCTMPEGSYISVRFGDVQKQTQYDVKKLYRFPEARRFGKIDIYHRVGTCDVAWDADQPETRTLKAMGKGGDSGLRLKVSMTRPAGEALKASENAANAAKASKKEAPAHAKKYLKDNDVEGILTGAMRALLKAMPEDAPTFLCDYIKAQYLPKSQNQEKQTRVTPAPKRSAPLEGGADFKHYYSANVLHSQHGFFPSFFVRNFPRNRVRPNQKAQKPKGATMGSNLGFLQYYRANLLTKQELVQPSFFARNFAKRSAGGAKSTMVKPFHLKPSVGTWLQRAPPIKQDSLGDVNFLRSKVRDVLQNSLENGALTEALCSISRGGSYKLDDDFHLVKEKMKMALMGSLEDGSLNEILENKVFPNSCTKQRLEELRSCAAVTLLQAASNGVLSQAIDQVTNQTQTPIEQLRARAARTMLEASDNGQLMRAIQEVVNAQHKAEKLRELTAERLIGALNDGSLPDIMAQAYKECQEMQASANVPGKNDWCKKPSVGTWIMAKPREPAVSTAPPSSAWHKKPSVGTWLMKLPESSEDCPSPQPAATSTGKAKWYHAPSVGTWHGGRRIQRGSGPRVQPWYLKASVGTWYTPLQ